MTDGRPDPAIVSLRGDSQCEGIRSMTNAKVRFERLRSLLRCPACCGPYCYEPVPQPDTDGVYGLLHCRCRSWPVLDSIPILAERRVGAYEHTTGTEEYRGPTPFELTDLIRTGKGTEALLDCLAIPVVLPGMLRRLPLLRGLSRRPETLAIGRGLRRAQLRRMLGRAEASEYARDWLATFFGRWSPLSGDLFSYYFHRLCMPRYLAAMEIMSTIPGTAKPVLDVACGFGHFGHFLTASRIADWVVGADFNFFPMWAAKRTIAPDASFVFLDAGQPLPFADRQFGAAICSDAFHYVPNKKGLVAELSRIVDAGPLVLNRVGNGAVLPPEGEELTAAGYLDLFGAERTWLSAEGELVKGYLSRHTPDLSVRVDPESLRHEKWLSAVLLPDGVEPPRPTRLATWPHELGRLQLNPMYRPAPQPDGSVVVRLEVPGTWFALENAGLTAYMPFEATIPADAVAALRAGRRTPEIDSLIGRFVLLGLPERYAPDPLGLPGPGASRRSA